MSTARTTKRITAGFDASHQSRVLSTEQVPFFAPYPLYPDFQMQNLFYTEEHPQSLQTRHLDTPYDIALPKGACRFLKVRMPTKKEMSESLKAAGQPIPEDWKTFNVHNTDSVDYIYILSGRITYVVGGQCVELTTGDFLAQVGPEHTWINDHGEPCYLLCVMLGTEPSDQRKKLSVE